MRPNNHFYYCMMTLSDREMVQGLIDGDELVEQVFLDTYSEQILRTFTTTHAKMKLKTPLTSKIKKELLFALCENLHASKKNLSEAISDGRTINLSHYLELKATTFCRDKLLVSALKKRDVSVTRRVFYVREEKVISLRPLIITVLKENDLRDFENGGKRMSSVDIVPELYKLLMAKLDQDKFRFICSLRTYFKKSILRSYLTNYFRELKKERNEIDIDDYDISDALDVIDTAEFEDFVSVKYLEGLFKYMATHGAAERDVDIMRDRYLERMSYEEIADKRGETVSNVGVIIHRTKKEMLHASRKYIYDE